MIFNNLPENFKPKFEVVSCFLEYNNKILLLKRHSQKTEGNTWGVPAGKILKNEKLQNAILREIKEETSIDVDIKNLKYFKKVYVSFPEYDFVYHMFYAKIVSQNYKVSINPVEHTEYTWEKPLSALKMKLMRDEDKCIKMFYQI